MVSAILTSVGGFLFLMAVWFLVQEYIRRHMFSGRDVDVLEDMAEGCGCCENSSSCSTAHQSAPVQLIQIEPKVSTPWRQHA